MASNKDLTAAIEARATELGIDFPSTEGLTNAELVALKKELDAHTPAEPEAEPEAAPEAAPEADEAHPFSVAPGKSVTSLKGILADGAEVKAEYFNEGAKTLAALVALGVVVKA